jgi:hypothetical protein
MRIPHILNVREVDPGIPWRSQLDSIRVKLGIQLEAQQGILLADRVNIYCVER